MKMGITDVSQVDRDSFFTTCEIRETRFYVIRITMVTVSKDTERNRTFATIDGS